MSTSADEPFEKKQHYRVRTSFKALRDRFSEGEVLEYVESVYSRYDGITGFVFVDSNNKTRIWDVADDEPLDVWSELFEKQEELNQQPNGGTS